ncbi:MAG: sortase family protein [Frankiales bacterium]|nr:sortase family protein [Frankiales bacterium]
MTPRPGAAPATPPPPPPPPAPASPPPSTGVADRIRWYARGIGQLLITMGVVVLLFCGYELWITGLYTRQQQHELGKGLDRTWSQAPPANPRKPLPYVVGKGIARIWFPTLGKGAHYVVVEGVATDDLKKGPGHYPTSARIGAIGNVVISGHRTTYLAPFNRVDELHAGDPIVLETQSFWYTYTVTSETVVQPTAIEVTYPVPGQLGRRPTQRLLTLTTCNPKYSARTRLIVHATMTAPLAKGSGVVPTALDQVLKG